MVRNMNQEQEAADAKKQIEDLAEKYLAAGAKAENYRDENTLLKVEIADLKVERQICDTLIHDQCQEIEELSAEIGRLRAIIKHNGLQFPAPATTKDPL